jgi:predicted nucleotidyltransferase
MKRKFPDNLNAIRESLRDLMPELQTRYGVKSLGIFGSYVHGQQKSRSDVDLLVELDEHAPVTLVNFVALERALGKRLGHKVDLVERDALKPVIGSRILAEVLPV